MTTAADVLDIARGYVNRQTYEEPDGTNQVWDITDVYGMAGAWCCMFVSRVMDRAGLPLNGWNGPKGFAWCSDAADWMRAQGWGVDPMNAAPGDIILFEWGSTAGGYDHIGFASGWCDGGGYLDTLEGNISNMADYRRRFVPGEIPECFRPPYATDPPPEPPRRRQNMIILPNIDGHREILDLNHEGVVVVSWESGPGTGSFSSWVPIGPPNSQPFPAESLTANVMPDGRIEAVISGAPFGILWASHQTTPNGGGWGGWYQLTDL